MPFEKIRNQIRQDLEPVKPLGPPWRRASILFGVWFVLVALVLILFGLRPDTDALGGPWLFWILPLVQLFSAYAVIVLGIRLTVPGSAVASSFMAGFVALGVAVHLAVSWTMFHLSPIEVEPGKDFHASSVCLAITLCLSILPLVSALAISRRGMPSHPGSVGLVCGFACGLSAEAVWRLHCPYNSWTHILSSHTTAVLAAVLLGWILSRLFFRYYGKRQSRPASSPDEAQ
jgi:hypothetical protein